MDFSKYYKYLFLKIIAHKECKARKAHAANICYFLVYFVFISILITSMKYFLIFFINIYL